MRTAPCRDWPAHGARRAFLVATAWFCLGGLVPAPVLAQIIVPGDTSGQQSLQDPSPQQQTPLELLPLAVDRPAPDLGLYEWFGKTDFAAGMGPVVRAGGGELDDLSEAAKDKIKETLAKFDKALANSKWGKKTAGGLTAYHRKVVIVHVIDWADPSSSTDLIELMRTVFKANEDHGVQLLGIMEKGDKAQKRARDAGIDWPLAMTSLRVSPSPYIVASQQPRAFVIGRSGALLWQGNPTSDRVAFSAVLVDAFARLPRQRVDRDLVQELGTALKDYYRGSLAKSLAATKRLYSKSRKGVATPLQMHAKYLAAKVHATEVDWLQMMRKTSALCQDFDQYVQHVAALVAEFSKTSGKDARANEKQISKMSNYAMRLKDERAWLKCISARPALFPARQSKAGDRFLKRLGKFIKGTRHATDAITRAQSLADRYRAATK
ncbi:MAG: hypothetical protein ACI9S9_001427 [Planctomycetota bacterium]|jgi:hypothetical protein